MRKEYLGQAKLMLRVLAHVNTEECFALKGGSAINFFIWDMPRLSVDIDLTYLPLEPRERSLRGINDALLRIGSSATKAIPQSNANATRAGGLAFKLVIRTPAAEVKIEPNTTVKEGKPDWALLGVEGVERLPAVQWKLRNIGRMAQAKHQEQLGKLREKLGL